MTPTVPGDPIILEPLDKLAEGPKRSAVIFLHGLGDDGHGTGYGLAQQFQRYQKLRCTRWVLPTAPVDPQVGQRCWYRPHELPSAPRPPRVPGREGGGGAQADAPEDEGGILKAVAYLDELVRREVDRGVEPGRIAVGGFSQGCAVAMVWGLRGEWRDKVAGVFGLSGYLPSINAVSEAGKGSEGRAQHAPRWFFGHGMVDSLVSVSLFAEGQKRLQQYVEEESIEGHVYQDLGHDVGMSEVRDLWLWFKQVLKDDS
ncbi:putative acyl-protein thioesterase 1 [Diaporthe ampelina]|uniref:Acyl-protein thioesterase 1 n=1 Tax=Diaporthe ampelina TaxID=1214573 RepID=A0A0G2HTX0_9PEZI|nr:putative acyl-protein thioesterase 1 [Diaporthe ampelina]